MYEKIKQSISEVLITIRGLHDLSDGEIEAMATFMATMCVSDQGIRKIFYREFGNIHDEIKKEYARRREMILNTIPEDQREEVDKKAQEEANKKLNKKNVMN
jgi:hypothetical protein